MECVYFWEIVRLFLKLSYFRLTKHLICRLLIQKTLMISCTLLFNIIRDILTMHQLFRYSTFTLLLKRSITHRVNHKTILVMHSLKVHLHLVHPISQIQSHITQINHPIISTDCHQVQSQLIYLGRHIDEINELVRLKRKSPAPQLDLRVGRRSPFPSFD